MTNSVIVPPLVKYVANGVSGQVRSLNRIWLATLLVATVLLLEPIRAPLKTGMRELPFGLGGIEPGWFYPLGTVILGSLSVCLVVAHVQVVRATKLAHRIVDAAREYMTLPDGVDLGDLYDVFRSRSISRVALLVQATKGRYQFFGSEAGCPECWATLAACYYLVLRLLGIEVTVVLPGAA